MCGRYTLQQVNNLQARFQLDAPIAGLEASHDVRPTTAEPVIVFDASTGRRRGERMIWGLIPSWARDAGAASRAINARAETIMEKPSFKPLFRTRRCLVPADGFYEWRAEGSKKVPYRFGMKDESLFAFAGLWSVWRNPQGGEMNTFTIITTEPNELVAPYHNRMPVILRQGDEARWIDDPSADPMGLLALLAPFPAELMQVRPATL